MTLEEFNEQMGSTQFKGSGTIMMCPPWPPYPFPWPQPMPFPFPWPPKPWEFEESGDETPLDLDLRAKVVANNTTVNKASKLHDKIGQEFLDKVLPKLEQASNIEEVQKAMSPVYEVFPTLQKDLVKVFEFYGGHGSGGGTGTVETAKKMPKWLKRVIKFIIKVLEWLIDD